VIFKRRLGGLELTISTAIDRNQWFAKCEIHGEQGEKTASIVCKTADGFSTIPIIVSYDTWQIVRFDVDSENITITFFVDGQIVGNYIPRERSELKNTEYFLMLDGLSSNNGSLTGSFNYVQLINK
jgi:ribosome biogenesis SPOUT family RNA methylase Rps3